MTTETNNEETPKKKRSRKAAAAETIPAPVETDLAETGEAPAATARDEWAAAAAEADAHVASEWEWEESEEVIPVKLGSADKARLLDENAVDQKAKDEVDAKIDALKDQIKTLKAEADVILSRTEERNRACGAGIEQRRDTWKVGTCFAVNTVRYLDRETGQVMHERPIENHERQVSLPLDEKPAAGAQMNLGDVEPTDMTDPEALLRAAQEGDEADAALDNDGSSDDLGDDEDDDS